MAFRPGIVIRFEWKATFTISDEKKTKTITAGDSNTILAIQEKRESAQEIEPSIGQSLGALGQVVDVVDTEQAQPSIRSGVIFVPVLLADIVRLAELGPFVGHG